MSKPTLERNASSEANPPELTRSQFLSKELRVPFFIITVFVVGFSVYQIGWAAFNTGPELIGSLDQRTKSLLFSCEPLPAANTASFFSGNRPELPSPQDYSNAAIQLSNELNTPAVVVLSSMDNLPFASFTIYPHEQLQSALPVGEYKVSMMSGRAWCNYKESFPGGLKEISEHNLLIKTGLKTIFELNLESTTKPINMAVRYTM